MRNRILLVVFLDINVQNADIAAQEITSGNWQTKVSNRDGDISLHWTHVYEGNDTVYRIDITPKGGPTTSVQVEGQPVFNSDNTLVALPYCADDGCLAEIEIVDLVARRKLRSVNVPEEGQFYITCTWRGNVLRTAVEVASTAGNNSRKTTHEFSMSTEP